ncbi:hypothetical protein DCO58_00790 [Helicobacter saguini]|uniref:Lipoprotein n=1 Tax=Helicobacter saguini TaxID=1548018 RepID=A0A347VR16_9HELI|nr:hypothetical protein [Helicobacter saguini]MWV63074.1 hypothetical protein [Helicobacter saguini]MWV66256.1 hypothetical protein [Helicobacter saguini]MWV68609.1 hypothetical protein [Helicobacter saguini]MWV71840.1 hypothetical protein [Helicobacter saguini]TLD95861.1 hypothetical protein LS64_000380 [Helicobacter saguini]
MLNYKQVLSRSAKIGLLAGSVVMLVACSGNNGPKKVKGNGYGFDEVKPDARQFAVYKQVGYSLDPQLPAYEPKTLNENARGIAVAYSVPYNCKVLGEVEGKDDTEGRAGPTFEKIRDGAQNDLKNQAGDLVRGGQRLMLSVTKEAMICQVRTKKDQYQEYDCTLWNKLPTNSKILSYRIHANVFECGEK